METAPLPSPFAPVRLLILAFPSLAALGLAVLAVAARRPSSAEPRQAASPRCADPSPQPRGLERSWVDEGDLRSVSRPAIETLLCDAFLSCPLVVPRSDDGSITLEKGGVRVWGIGPGSPLAQLGLENGDTILRVNGLSAGTPGGAWVVYDRTSPRATVEVVRRGQHHVYFYRLPDQRR